MRDAIRKIIQGCLEADEKGLNEAVDEALREEIAGWFTQDEIWNTTRKAGEATPTGSQKATEMGRGGVNDPSHATNWDRMVAATKKAGAATKFSDKWNPRAVTVLGEPARRKQVGESKELDEANVAAFMHLKDGNTYLTKGGKPAQIVSHAPEAGWFNVRFKTGPMTKISGEDFIIAGKIYQVSTTSPKART